MTEYRSTDQWLDEQPWHAETIAEAKAMHASRVARNLNPMTLGQWQAWAEPREAARDEAEDWGIFRQA